MKKIIFGVILILTFLNNSYANYKKLAYDFSFNGIDGEEIKLSEYRNKVMIVVNVASRCGYTPQYQSLQNLWQN